MKTLQIYRAIKSNWLSQGFGESRACCKTVNGNIIRPFSVVGKITVNNQAVCPPSSVDFYKVGLGMNGHNGKDWTAIRGEVVYMGGDFDGIVKNEVDNDGGIGVRVFSKEPLKLKDGEGYVCIGYWHLQKSLLPDGANVKLGDALGLANSTGASSGDHVHEFLKVVDSFGNTLNQDNGYFGAINQDDYFSNVFAVDALKTREDAVKKTKEALEEIGKSVDILANSNLFFKESLLVTIQRYLLVVVEWLKSIISKNNLGTMIDKTHPAPAVFGYASATGDGDIGLRYKAMMLGFVPVVIAIAGYFNVPLVQSELVEAINNITIGLSGLGFVWGIIRPYIYRKAGI